MDELCKFWFTLQCDWCGEVVDAGATHGTLCGEFVWMMPICPCCGAGTIVKMNYEDFILAVVGGDK